MSLTELYSIESKFNEKRKEYISIMDSINHKCLGKNKLGKQCVRAAQLNADMQTALIKLSTLSILYPPSNQPLDSQQKNILKMSDSLENDLKKLNTSYKINEDLSITNEMNKQNAIVWGIGMIVILSIVFYQYKKI